MSEKYTYKLTDRQRVLQTCQAETLTEAIEQLCPGAKVDHEGHFMAVVTEKGRRSFGITWAPDPELLAAAKGLVVILNREIPSGITDDELAARNKVYAIIAQVEGRAA